MKIDPDRVKRLTANCTVADEDTYGHKIAKQILVEQMAKEIIDKCFEHNKVWTEKTTVEGSMGTVTLTYYRISLDVIVPKTPGV